MAQRINMNRGWLYCPDDPPGAEAISFDESTWTPVNVPHTNKLFPHHGFDDAEYQFISWYRKRISIPDSERAARVFLDFDAVMLVCEVYVNGMKAGEHKGGYTPFSVPINDSGGKEALVAVRVDSRERSDIPPFGYNVDFLTFGGIYRDVHLRVCPHSFIANVFAKGRDVLTAPRLEVDIKIEEPSSSQTVTVTLKTPTGEVVAKGAAPASEHTPITMETHKEIRLWSIEDPFLYQVRVDLQDPKGVLIDSETTRFGFREARFGKDGTFRLNGTELKLVGLNRHQTFPYIGQAAPKRLQQRDAEILKFDLALNVVRTSHYPQSPHFLDRCDEIGLLVFEEIPGWSHIGDQSWQGLVKQDVHDMVMRDRNHPSIILWGVRINESEDNHDLYVETNRIARELDPTRQTGGVRTLLKNSEFLEDVFTYNDYSDAVLDPIQVPYLITEFGGPLLPTKSWDCDLRKVEHALMFAKAVSMQKLDKRIAGGIGWCAFDYNTHCVFGVGDRIDYQGVSDIFRLPKFAASFYASQSSPSRRVVLVIASHWARWERPLGGMDSLIVFSNCESIKLYIQGSLRGEYFPSTKQFPGLTHPPFIITGLGNLYDDWGDLKVEGLIGGDKVAEARKTKDPLPNSLRLWVDADELLADGQDMVALNFQVVDKCANVCPYTSEIVTFSVQGPVQIVGTNPFAPQGGQGAVYLKSKEYSGQATIRAETPRLGSYEIVVNVRESMNDNPFKGIERYGQ